MEGKKNQRMTVKILNEEFDKKIQNLKETVESLEMRINDSEAKVKTLEEKLTERQNQQKNLVFGSKKT